MEERFDEDKGELWQIEELKAITKHMAFVQHRYRDHGRLAMIIAKIFFLLNEKAYLP